MAEWNWKLMTWPPGGLRDVEGTAAIPQVLSRPVDGVRIRYADSGGSEERTLLRTSAWPENLYADVRAFLD